MRECVHSNGNKEVERQRRDPAAPQEGEASVRLERLHPASSAE